MNYQVLARKWRPKSFSEIVGHELVLTALINSISRKRVHHAYLFSGVRGVGKTTLARLLTKSLNCESGITEFPCRKCKICCEIEEGRFVDLIEIDAASRTKVEDTREFLDNVQYRPVRGRFKIFLIDEIHMLSRHSFNALLKTLEEPPSHVKFFLVTTNPEKIPITVLSRCLRLHLNLLSRNEISLKLQEILKNEGIYSDFSALSLLAKAADGSMRDALSLLEQAINVSQGKIDCSLVRRMLGSFSSEQALNLVEALLNGIVNRVMELLNEFASYGFDYDSLLVEMLCLLHRITVLQFFPSSIFNEDSSEVTERLLKLSRLITETDIQLYYQILLMGRRDLVLAPDRRIGLEMTLLRALAFRPFREESGVKGKDFVNFEEENDKLVNENSKKEVFKNFSSITKKKSNLLNNNFQIFENPIGFSDQKKCGLKKKM